MLRALMKPALLQVQEFEKAWEFKFRLTHRLSLSEENTWYVQLTESLMLHE